MRALFSFLEREVYPQYDAVSLLGQRRLYERFGFAKVYPFLEYAFCFPAQQTECGVERLDRGCRDNDLFTLYQQYGKGPSRSPALFFETAATNGHGPSAVWGRSYGWKNTGEPLMRPAVRIITASQSCAEPCRWRTPAA